MQPLSPVSSPYSNTHTNPTHHLPLQPIFSPCFLRAYVLYVRVSLCAFVFNVPMWLRNSFLCIFLCLYTLHAFLCVNTSGLFIYPVFFQNMLVIPVFFSWCLFPSHGFSAYVFQCFRLFHAVRAQKYLGPKKRTYTLFSKSPFLLSYYVNLPLL